MQMCRQAAICQKEKVAVAERREGIDKAVGTSIGHTGARNYHTKERCIELVKYFLEIFLHFQQWKVLFNCDQGSRMPFVVTMANKLITGLSLVP